MSSTGLVTVLVPAFNAAPYLTETVESVLRQEDVDLEVVVVDDASTDGTADEADVLARRDGRVRVVRNGRNLGMTANWNRSLGEARGGLVLKLDADDVLKPACLGQLSAAFEDPEVVAAGIRTLECDPHGQVVAAFRGDAGMEREGLDPFRDAVRPARVWWRASVRGHQLWHSSAWMRRTTALRSEGGWDERFGCASDTEGILRVLEGPGKVAHVAKVGVLYRLLGGSVSDRFGRSGAKSLEALAAYYLSASRVSAAEKVSRTVSRDRASRYAALRAMLDAQGGDEVLAATRRRMRGVVGSVPAPSVATRTLWALYGFGSRLLSGA